MNRRTQIIGGPLGVTVALIILAALTSRVYWDIAIVGVLGAAVVWLWRA